MILPGVRQSMHLSQVFEATRRLWNYQYLSLLAPHQRILLANFRRASSGTYGQPSASAQFHEEYIFFRRLAEERSGTPLLRGLSVSYK